MTHRFPNLFAGAALAAMMSLSAAAQEYSNGGTGGAGRGPATLTPVEAYGVHPPGLAPADAGHYRPYVPYYAPLSPVASSTRWRPWGYFPLFPYFTPYYTGYCPGRLFNPRPRPYGWNGWGNGPMPEAPLPDEPGTTPLRYGNYTSVVDDDTIFWNMGGNGLVPYGEVEFSTDRPPDLIDAIRASRPHAHHRRMHPMAMPVMVTPVEEGQPVEGETDNSSHRRAKPAEPIPPGSAAPEQGDGADRSGDKPTKRAIAPRTQPKSENNSVARDS
ncbi:MAG TPA: hypothetical protein VHC22_23055 [Pirellulales bacterium]|nr:hypothetical protein [Pirellulales bacterium]